MVSHYQLTAAISLKSWQPLVANPSSDGYNPQIEFRKRRFATLVEGDLDELSSFIIERCVAQ